MIELKHINFAYSAQQIFDDVSLILDNSWKLAVVGRNGRGKTTFMKLLLGQLSYSGEIHLDKPVSYFPQEIEDKSSLTTDILSTLNQVEEWKIYRELKLLGLSDDILWRPFNTLSGGEQTKVLLAALFLNEDHFLLIDEPTNHLDLISRQQVAAYLKQKKQGFLVSSHDSHFLDEVCDHLLALERNTIILSATNYSGYERQKKLRDEFEFSQNIKLKSEINRLTQTAQEKAEWSHNREKDKLGNPKQKGSGSVVNKGFIGARAARQMKKANVLTRRITKELEKKETLLKDLEKIDRLEMCYQTTHHSMLLEKENVTVTVEDKPLFQPFHLQVSSGEMIAISGRNGIGKTKLLEQINLFALSKGILVSYIKQQDESICGSLHAFCDGYQLDYPRFLNNLRKLGMEREVFNQRIETMSQGQQKKVALAKSLTEPAELYIWDEPLNYLDIDNQQQIEELLKTVKPSMIVVEHDVSFIKQVADKVIDLK